MIDGRRNRTEALLAGMAERLRALRLERGYLLKDISRMSGLSEPFLHRIEHGQRLPSLEALLTLANVYGVSPAALLAEAAPVWLTQHQASAVWSGREEDGAGVMRTTTGAGGGEFPYDRASRLGNGENCAPEQMIGMALAGCFSMSLANELSAAGFTPHRIETTATVELAGSESGISIRKVALATSADVDGPTLLRFREIAEHTRRSCVVSRALAAVAVTIDATLTGSAASDVA